MDGNNQEFRRRRDRDLVLDRDETGRVYASVPYNVRHYRVDELDWGYIGPATAELALNILNWVLPAGVDGEAPIQCEHGECSAVAWRLHRTFMAEVLVRVPYHGGCVKEQEIRRWVLTHFTLPGEPIRTHKNVSWLSSLMQG